MAFLSAICGAIFFIWFGISLIVIGYDYAMRKGSKPRVPWAFDEERFLRNTGGCLMTILGLFVTIYALGYAIEAVIILFGGQP